MYVKNASGGNAFQEMWDGKCFVDQINTCLRFPHLYEVDRCTQAKQLLLAIIDKLDNGLQRDS
jgi:hypothetical protein